MSRQPTNAPDRKEGKFNPYIDPRTGKTWTAIALDRTPDNTSDKPFIARRLANLILSNLCLGQQPMTPVQILSIFPFRPSVLYKRFTDRGYWGFLPIDVRWAVRFPHQDWPDENSEDMQDLKRELRLLETRGEIFETEDTEEEAEELQRQIEVVERDIEALREKERCGKLERGIGELEGRIESEGLEDKELKVEIVELELKVEREKEERVGRGELVKWV